MSEIQELNNAQSLIAINEQEKALPLLWKLYASKNQNIKLEAGLSLLTVFDQITENKKLLTITEESIKVASDLGRKDLRAYLLSKKAIFLFSDLFSLTYRRVNLKLAAEVFRWIEFSLEKDNKEFEGIIVKCDQLDKEISALEDEVLDFLQSTTDHYLRGNIFMSLGEISFNRFLNDQLVLRLGGKWRSKISNIYFVRRWKLHKFISYDRHGRKKLNASWNECVVFFKKAILEFKTGKHEMDLAHTLYNFSVKFTLILCFSRAKKYLNQARLLAEAKNDRVLLTKIAELKGQIKDKYRHPRNYVEEFGLDLPR